MTKSEIITRLDSADLFLRNRAKSAKAPLTKYDVGLFFDMAQTCHDATGVISSLTAEIERLKKENNQFADIGKMYSEIKSEVRKEFAEELKKEKCKHRNFGEFIFLDDIDSVLMRLESEAIQSETRQEPNPGTKTNYIR